MEVCSDGVECWEVDLSGDWRQERADSCTEDYQALLVVCEHGVWLLVEATVGLGRFFGSRQLLVGGHRHFCVRLRVFWFANGIDIVFLMVGAHFRGCVLFVAHPFFLGRHFAQRR